MSRQNRINRIRELVRRGATEGERAAARAALERMGEPVEAPQQKIWMPAEDTANVHYTTHNFSRAKAQYHQFYMEDVNKHFTIMFDEFTEKFKSMKDAGLSDKDISDMVANGTFREWKETK